MHYMRNGDFVSWIDPIQWNAYIKTIGIFFICVYAACNFKSNPLVYRRMAPLRISSLSAKNKIRLRDIRKQSPNMIKKEFTVLQVGAILLNNGHIAEDNCGIWTSFFLCTYLKQNILDDSLVLSGRLIFAIIIHEGFVVCSEANQILKSSAAETSSPADLIPSVLGSQVVIFIS